MVDLFDAIFEQMRFLAAERSRQEIQDAQQFPTAIRGLTDVCRKSSDALE